MVCPFDLKSKNQFSHRGQHSRDVKLEERPRQAGIARPGPPTAAGGSEEEETAAVNFRYDRDRLQVQCLVCRRNWDRAGPSNECWRAQRPWAGTNRLYPPLSDYGKSTRLPDISRHNWVWLLDRFRFQRCIIRTAAHVDRRRGAGCGRVAQPFQRNSKPAFLELRCLMS